MSEPKSRGRIWHWWVLYRLNSRSEQRRLDAVRDLSTRGEDPRVIAALIKCLGMWDSTRVRSAAAGVLTTATREPASNVIAVWNDEKKSVILSLGAPEQPQASDKHMEFWDEQTKELLWQGIAAAALSEGEEDILRVEISMLYDDFSSLRARIQDEKNTALLERAQQFGTPSVAEGAAETITRLRAEHKAEEREKALAEETRVSAQRLEAERQRERARLAREADAQRAAAQRRLDEQRCKFCGLTRKDLSRKEKRRWNDGYLRTATVYSCTKCDVYYCDYCKEGTGDYWTSPCGCNHYDPYR